MGSGGWYRDPNLVRLLVANMVVCEDVLPEFLYDLVPFKELTHHARPLALKGTVADHDRRTSGMKARAKDRLGLARPLDVDLLHRGLHHRVHDVMDMCSL